jgi:hypothetical protein
MQICRDRVREVEREREQSREREVVCGRERGITLIGKDRYIDM